MLAVSIRHFCRVLEKSHIGAKSDFEIWRFKGFFSLDPKKGPKEGSQVATPEILKWKKYIKQSKNTNGSPLEPLYGSKKKKVSTIMTFRPINLPFCSGEKSYWCRFEKKEKSHHGASTLVWEKSHNGALNCTKMTFLQNTNEPH